MQRADNVRALPSIRSLIRHQLGVILVVAAAAMGIAGLYIASSPPSYSASAVMLLSPAPGNPLTPEAASGSAVQMTVALETEAQLVKTPVVSAVVSKAVGSELPRAGDRLAVSVPSNTQMLDVTYTASSPERAQEGAQGFAEGYLDYRAERARAVQESRVTKLNEQIAATEENLRRAVGDAAAAGAPTYASQEVQLYADRLAQLSISLSSAEAVSTAPGTVISSASVPERANGVAPWTLLLAAVVLGLGAGVGLAMLREWRRDLLRDSNSTSEGGLPILATVRAASQDIAGTGPSDAHESYRQLRTAVIANGSPPYALGVAALGGDGAEEVAADLAVVLGEAQFSVLLIATDPKNRRVERYLGIAPGPGLADVVLGGAPVKDLLVEAHGISLLAAGADSPGSRDITATSVFRSTVSELQKEFDYVILSAGGAGSADSDAVLLAADSALLVLRPGATTRTLIEATLDRLERLGVRPMGAVRVARLDSVSASDVEPDDLPAPEHGAGDRGLSEAVRAGA